MKSPLEINGLTKRYGNEPAIKDISFAVEPGEVFGFLGPNGAGKTTTIRTIMNFLRPSEGSIRVLGLDSVEHSLAIKAKVGYLAGDFELYDNLTAKQYLEFIANLRGVAWQSVTELSDRLNVTMHKKIAMLSRGNKQKVGLVAALMHDPELLILDEPTSGLDPLVQNQFYEILKEHSKKGKATFISSHILSEVQEVCDRVAFMRSGELIETVNVRKITSGAKKHVVISTKPGTKLMQLPKFKGLEVLSHTVRKVEFKTSEPAKELLSWLNMQPVAEITIQPVNLEDVFLKLYGAHVGGTDV